jgi:hypothetical protein
MIQRQAERALEDSPEPAGVEEIRELVTDEANRLEAGSMLKYCFLIQQQRMAEIRAMEQKLGIILPQGNKAILLLTQIAAEIHKAEFAQAYLRMGGTRDVSTIAREWTPNERTGS